MINLKRILPRNLRGKIMHTLRFLPDVPYVKLFYFATTGKRLDLKNPVGFNEKINWLKFNNIHPEYSTLVDKYVVRRHIDETLGEGFMFPLLGKWESFDEIEFDKLPNSFVLKCNHDSGSVTVIKDKTKLTSDDYRNLRKKYNSRLNRNFYYAGREYCYKGIENRYILAEQLMYDEKKPNEAIEDYKFYCFDGIPKIVLIVTDRYGDCRFDFYDMNFHHLKLQRHRPNSSIEIERPNQFEEMKKIASVLSKNMKFVRIDLYQLNGKIYFGEYTFFPGGGFELFKPDEWEKRLGDWIILT